MQLVPVSEKSCWIPGPGLPNLPSMAEAHLALLRAINLGPKNKISMPDLGEVFGSSGCKNVRTYIQSGNVIFQAAPDLVTRLPGLIRAAIEKRFGYNVPVILRAL